MNSDVKKYLLIHDLEDAGAIAEKIGDCEVIAGNDTMSHCVGCFGCWTKTPTTCVIRDSYEDIGRRFGECDEIIVISRCVYGGFSPAVKNILDRCIGYLLPYFTIRKDKKMHHSSRYKKQLQLKFYFYGEDIRSEEQRTASRLVKANALNLNAGSSDSEFFRNIEEIGRCFA